MTRAVLITSSVYMAGVGLALMFFPIEFGRGAVPPDASPQLVALLRLLGGPFLGIAVLNFLSRNATPAGLRAILIANLVGFAAVTANDVWGVATGSSREIAKLFLLVHLLFTGAFIATVWRNRNST
ncbi:MAG: hypothetical protein Q7T81_13370 [Pseudolabrys sp.]|nr:hypothetical protein [Pseudolabrys sp.]